MTDEIHIKASFLRAVTALVSSSVLVCTTEEMHQLHLDKLAYFEQLQQSGEYAPDKLWNHA